MDEYLFKEIQRHQTHDGGLRDNSKGKDRLSKLLGQRNFVRQQIESRIDKFCSEENQEKLLKG